MELLWVGLSFDPEERRPGDSIALWQLGKFDGRPNIGSRELPDGTRIQSFNLPGFGVAHRITDAAGITTGFGMLVDSPEEGRGLIGKANRIVGFLGIDQEVTVWARAVLEKKEIPA